MPEYIIRFNSGYGDCIEIVTADDELQAGEEAYQAWLEDAERNAEYEVIGEATPELKKEYDLE